MNELVRDELIRIVRENSEDVLLDPVRTKAFLNDFCGNKYRREINSITLALKEGAVTELLNSRRNRTERFAIARLSKNLEESFGFPRQQTIWTVESIAIALGVISQDETVEIESVGSSELERFPETKPEEARSPQFIQDEEKVSGPTIKVKKKRIALPLLILLSLMMIFLFNLPLLGMLSLLFILLFKLISGDNVENQSSSAVMEMKLEETSNPYGDELVYVEGGTFVMGDTWGDGYSDEKPTHKVTFTYDFYLGKYPVTFEDYDRYCRDTRRTQPKDKDWGRERRPVMNIKWWDAIAYCNWLSDREGLPIAYRLRGESAEGQILDAYGNLTSDIAEVVGYRLPTEAEWEYAARGGNMSKGYKYSGSNKVGDVAWYVSNSGFETQEVGKKRPNELGIYDMSGNLWEWCSDWHDSWYYSMSPTTNPYNSTAGSYRVSRGGSWSYNAAFMRVSLRGLDNPSSISGDLGFRIARTAH